ncbi:ketopantoate reductase family protein [Streptomyces sp. NPDC001037]|uniref:ketopantoate reductase family protein n=1 Tax=Streptomyces sp. NPDC001037 TaxID=3364542 RepID=UPI0036830318
MTGNSPSIGIVGAGSVGVNAAYDLTRAGAKITFLVRPHRQEQLSRPQVMYSYKDHTLDRFFGYDVIADAAELSNQRFDFLIVTLDNAALRAEAGLTLVKEVGRAFRGTDTGVILAAVGIEVRAWFLAESGLSEEQVAMGNTGALIHEVAAANLPVDPSVDAELLAQADYAFIHLGPAGFTIDDSAPKLAEAFIAVYSGNGVPAAEIAPADTLAVGVAGLAPILALGLLDWRPLDEIDPADATWRLGVDSMREIQRLAAFGPAGQAAGIGTGQARGQQRKRLPRVPGPLRAEGGGGLVEAVVEDAGVQGLRQVLEHGAQPGGAGDDAGQVAQLPADAVELSVETAGGASAAAVAVVPVAVEILDVVQLGDGAFGGDLGGKPGGRGARVAFEQGELGVLVLPGARDHAERLVGDVPGEGAAELSGAQPPRHGFLLSNISLLTAWFVVSGRVGVRHRCGCVQRHVGAVWGAEQCVEVVAEVVEASVDRAEQDEAVAGHAFVAEQVGRVVVDGVEERDGLVDDVEHDPFGSLASELAALEDPSAQLVADAAVRAVLGECAVGGEFPYFGVSHSGQVRDHDPTGHAQLDHFGRQLQRAKARPPWASATRPVRQRGPYTADLIAEFGGGVGKVPADLGGFGYASQKRDQRDVGRLQYPVDFGDARPPRSLARRPGGDTAARGTELGHVLLDPGPGGAVSAMRPSLPVRGGQSGVLGLGGQDVGAGGGDVEDGALHKRSDDRLRDALGSVLFVADHSGHRVRGPAGPGVQQQPIRSQERTVGEQVFHCGHPQGSFLGRNGLPALQRGLQMF